MKLENPGPQNNPKHSKSFRTPPPVAGGLQMAHVVCASVLNDARPASFLDKLVELLHVCGKAGLKLG